MVCQRVARINATKQNHVQKTKQEIVKAARLLYPEIQTNPYFVAAYSLEKLENARIEAVGVGSQPIQPLAATKCFPTAAAAVGDTRLAAVLPSRNSNDYNRSYRLYQCVRFAD